MGLGLRACAGSPGALASLLRRASRVLAAVTFRLVTLSFTLTLTCGFSTIKSVTGLTTWRLRFGGVLHPDPRFSTWKSKGFGVAYEVGMLCSRSRVHGMRDSPTSPFPTPSLKTTYQHCSSVSGLVSIPLIPLQRAQTRETFWNQGLTPWVLQA